jgi:hypothetical protein
MLLTNGFSTVNIAGYEDGFSSESFDFTDKDIQQQLIYCRTDTP